MADDYKPGVTECIHLKHLDPNGPIETRTIRDKLINTDGGRYAIACTPTSGMPQYATSETSAVTCPLCKASEAFKRVAAEQDPLNSGSEADKAVMAFLKSKSEQGK